MLDSWMEMLQVNETTATVATVLVSLAFGVALSTLLSWHYMRFGRTYSNRRELAQVFPLVVLSTVLIISLVSTNIALSLGLVGALSIVRFRTPIKEPEELAYLFAGIATGIGLGAQQYAITVTSMAVILTVVALRTPWMGRDQDHNLFLNLELGRDEDGNGSFRDIQSVLAGQSVAAHVRRFDTRDGVIQATYSVQCSNNNNLLTTMEALQEALPEAHISFIEQKGIPAL